MDWLFQTFSPPSLVGLEEEIGIWVLFVSLAFLAFEFVRYAFRRNLKWPMAGDTVTNFLTLVMSFVVNGIFFATLFVFAYFGAAQFALFDIPVNVATVLIGIVLADLAYYWEHRFLHRVNIAWATHSVHHSSPFFNISVAYRFGPMDGFWPVFFHVPLILAGFNPFVVIFAEIFVQLYQTFLHTESIKKLPKPIEWLFNTPSHHRVHHGSNPEYLDANYGGIFIIWDRMFGTFAREEEKVVYGLVRPIPEITTAKRMLAAPFVAFFHGFPRVLKRTFSCRSISDVWMSWFGPPEWTPKQPVIQESMK